MAVLHVAGRDVGLEARGRFEDPLVLLLGAPTLLSWPEELCDRLVTAGRRVVRCDLRDAGESTTGDLMAPDDTLGDLAADVAALIGELGAESAHVAGLGISGFVAQRAALDHSDVVSALTLVGTRPVAPGPVDADLPNHEPSVMEAFMAQPAPDWSHRAAVVDHARRLAPALGNDVLEAGVRAGRIWDRTASAGRDAHLANQQGTVFSRLDCGPRWRERLRTLDVPTLVVHGRADPFFPVGNGEALAAEIPGARLLVVDEMGTDLPGAAVESVAAAMLSV